MSAVKREREREREREWGRERFRERPLGSVREEAWPGIDCSRVKNEVTAENTFARVLSHGRSVQSVAERGRERERKAEKKRNKLERSILKVQLW
jgi:hypothetical protein